MKKKVEKRKPTFWESLLCVIILLVVFGLGTMLDLPTPPLIAVVVAFIVIIGYRCGYTWGEMEEYTSAKIKSAAPSLSVLLAVGFLLGAWIFSGTIPMFIYFGVQLVSERWILVSAFVLCAIFSTVTGTSWGSAATAGVTMMGVASGMPNVNIAAVAGACYTGAIFGDKLSPLSDTTILASLSTKNDIFEHIRHMAKTVVPGAVLGLAIYFVMGFNYQASNSGLPQDTIDMLTSLSEIFKWNIILLLPVAVVIYGSVAKKPSTPSLFISVIVAFLIGVFYQGFSIPNGITAMYNGFSVSMAESVREGLNVKVINAGALKLIERGGLASMLKSFILIYICFYFAGIMEQIGAIDVLLGKVINSVKTRLGLVISTAVSCVILVAIGGSSTLALLLVGELYSEKYKEMGLSTLNLSRTMEDFCTGTAGFIPWSGSGVYYPSILGVSIAGYLPYCFMSFFIWIIALIYAATGIGMKKIEPGR